MYRLALILITSIVFAACSTDSAQTETSACEATGFWHYIERLDALPDKSDGIRWWDNVVRLDADSPDALFYQVQLTEPHLNHQELDGKVKWSYTDENDVPTTTITKSIQITYANDAVDSMTFHEGCDVMRGTKISPIRNGELYMFRFDTIEDYVPWYKWSTYVIGNNFEFDPPKPSRFDRE